jgi:hypothetical protein
MSYEGLSPEQIEGLMKGSLNCGLKTSSDCALPDIQSEHLRYFNAFNGNGQAIATRLREENGMINNHLDNLLSQPEYSNGLRRK